MTPADRRISELIEKWLVSIDLHLQYVELSDAAYARVQPWPRHERPTRWVLEVARQKLLELKAQCETRQDMGDGKFSESLELMAFLANLVGIQHIQRFIPQAEPGREASTGNTQTVEAPVVRTGTQRMRTADDATREMPKLRVAAPKAPAPAAPKASAPAPKAQPAAAPAKVAEKKPAKASPAAAPKTSPALKAILGGDMKSKIIADAVRLMKWGKSWHELPETIERIAERPPASEIRKVLRAHRSEIESKVAKAAK